MGKDAPIARMEKWEDFFWDVNLGKPQFLKLFFERLFFRIFECWSGFAIGQQKQGPRDTPDSREGLKSYVATLLSDTWYLLVVGCYELVRTSIARFMRKQPTEVITNFKTSNL